MTIVGHLKLSISPAFGIVNYRSLVAGLQGTTKGKVDTVDGLLWMSS
jgi:hypothetical protein